MSATGIGASVKRKEDIRFITGKGRYVDDFNRPGQAYAYFLRSPHAHATIDKIDASAAIKAPGVVGVFTGADSGRPTRSACISRRGTITSKDGSPMKVGAFPGARARQGALRRRPRRRRHRGDLCPGPRRGREGRGRLRRACPPVVDTGERGQARPAADPRRRSRTTRVYNWHLGDKAATDAAFAKAAHVTKLDLVNNRTIPNAIEPRAAIGDYDSGTRHHHALYDEPEPACRAAADVGVQASRRKINCA